MQATEATDTRGAALTLKQRVGKLIFPRLPVTRFLFDILRDEAAALLVRLQNACVPSRRSRLRRLRAGLFSSPCAPFPDALSFWPLSALPVLTAAR